MQLKIVQTGLYLNLKLALSMPREVAIARDNDRTSFDAIPHPQRRVRAWLSRADRLSAVGDEQSKRYRGS